MANTLQVGRPRVGICWDKTMPDGYPAMIHNTGEEVELVVSYSHNSPLARRFIGRGARWGDDPAYSLHEYELPEVVWFGDTYGHACLIGPFRPRATMAGTPDEGRACFRYAVFGGNDGSDYSKINRLRSRLEGLEEWFRASAVHHRRLHDDQGEPYDEIVLRRSPSVRFAGRLNASLNPQSSFSVAEVPGRSTIQDRVQILTEATTARTWSEHIALHQAVRDLVVVAGWRNFGLWGLEVRREDDPIRALAGNVLAPRWAPVLTHVVSEPSGEPAQNRFLFEYDEIGVKGLRRWMPLRERYARGVAGMIQSVRRPGAALETLVSDAGTALEHIGFQIASERREPPGQRIRPHLRRITAEIKADIGFQLDDWVLRTADVYRCVKHPDSPDPDSLVLLNTLREMRLVFRVWVATRLGMKSSLIERNVGLIPMGHPYTQK